MFFSREALPFPEDLDAALARALAKGASPKRGEALRGLWSKLAKGRGQAVAGEQHYSFRREEADAYAAYYLPVNCLKVPLVLEEGRLLGLDQAGELNWLDLGTGPGTAYWGLAWWCARLGKKLRFTGWDQSAQFTSIARDLAQTAPFRAQSEFITGEDPVTLVKKLKPTHVSFVNSIAEIYPDMAERTFELQKILRALQELERKDGRARYLLVVEPGSRDSSRELATLKDILKSEAQLLLPCLDNRPCGALVNPQDWCHEEVACEFPAWVNELGAAAGMRKEALLFSYAFFRSSPAPSWAHAGESRIVSQRMERKGQVECRICTVEGKKAVRVQRSKATLESEFFLTAARGDLWKSADIGEKGDIARADVISAAPSVFQDS
ncbi:MAG: small ribosomal subunit Rsm22 family protein [Bdellovibrionota bacterium]